MAGDYNTFGEVRARLDEIVSEVRKKDLSLEKSLDLYEEAIKLGNRCAELIGQWRGPLTTPTLSWDFKQKPDGCGWETGVRYPPQGNSAPLWRPAPAPKAQAQAQAEQATNSPQG